MWTIASPSSPSHLLCHSLFLSLAPSNTDTQHQSGVDTITPYPVDTIPPEGADQQ